MNQSKYRKYYFQADVKRARLGLGILLIPIIGFIFNDYALFSQSEWFYALLALRIIMATSILFMLFYLTRVKSYEKYEKSITIWGFLAVVSTAIISITRPANFVADQIIVSIVYIFIIFLVIPNRLLYQTISSLIVTLGVATAVILNENMVTLTALASFCFAFAIAISISWLLDVYRKQSFEEIEIRENAERALKDSEERFRALVETTSDWIWQTDENAKYTYASPKIKDILGYEPHEILGKTPFELMPKEEAEKVAQGFKKIIENKESFYNLENWNIDKNGGLVLLETSGVPVINEKGEFVGYRGIDRDITSRKRTQDELVQSQAKLLEYATSLEDLVEKRTKELQNSERLATIGQTAGMVGHDIRNPLQAILSDTYLLKDDLTSMPEGEKKEDVAESIDSIERNVAYINKIVQDLQDYSRQVVPEYSVADLSDVIVHVFETISVPESINLAINVKDSEKIRIDPTLLQRAITNLVNNAIQAMPDGGKLEICGEKIDTRIVVTVSDTGVGIPDEVKPKLFTPMMTTKSKGQGFGLAASKRMIEAMKGTISFESEKGKGTKFIIELPTS